MILHFAVTTHGTYVLVVVGDYYGVNLSIFTHCIVLAKIIQAYNITNPAVFTEDL